MRTVTFTAFGETEGIELRNTDKLAARDDEVLVDVAACGLNRHDLWVLRGESWVAERHLPFVSGLDVAGTVSEIGSDIENIELGDRVLACPSRSCGTCNHCQQGPETLCERYHMSHGGFAEQVVVPKHRLLDVPETLTLTEAATLPTSWMTAWQMIRRAEVDSGDTVVVPGATGGVGVATIQILDVFGVDTISTSRSSTKLDQLSKHCTTSTVEVESAGELYGKVREIGTPDAAITHLGGEYVTESLRTVGRAGTVIVCGRTTGRSATVDLSGMYVAHKQLVGSSMGTQADLAHVVRMAGDGRIRPIVGAKYGFEAASEAFEALAQNDVVGKIVLHPNA